MPAAATDAVLEFLHRTARLQQAAGATGAELLGRYVAGRDGGAFEALVRRHGPMVLGVCRRLLTNAQDAEDALQVSFLVLARKAASVRPRDRLAAWLHGAVLLAAAALCGGAALVARPFVLAAWAGGAGGDSASPAVVRSAGPQDGREPPPDAGEAAAPVTAKFIRKRGGKPPMRTFDVRLEVRNPEDHPVWLLTRYWGDEPLAEKGEFKSGSDQPFGGQEYDGAAKGGKGKAVEVVFLGDRPFRAFCLPARATVAFEDFGVECWSDVKEVEFWEAASLKVNGRTPLEKWLPYPTVSDAAAVIPAGTDWKNLDWDAEKLHSRTDYPKEAVKAVSAVVEKKWTVPITGIGKGDDD